MTVTWWMLAGLVLVSMCLGGVLMLVEVDRIEKRIHQMNAGSPQVSPRRYICRSKQRSEDRDA